MAGENTAQGKDQPLPRYLLKPPELRQWADKYQEEEGPQGVHHPTETASAVDSPGWIYGFSRMTGDQATDVQASQKRYQVAAFSCKDVQDIERAAVPLHPSEDGFYQSLEAQRSSR